MTVILLLHAALVLTFTARILLRDDLSPPGRLAWFIVLDRKSTRLNSSH